MKIFLQLLSTLLFLAYSSSCSKNNVNYISCTINGENKTFNFYAKAYDTTWVNGTNQIQVIGYAADSLTAPQFVLGIHNTPIGPAITGGTYCDTSGIFDVYSYYSTGRTLSDTTYQATSHIVSNASYNGIVINYLFINIMSRTRTEIQGTFSGDYYVSYIGLAQQVPLKIRNGRFRLSF